MTDRQTLRLKTDPIFDNEDEAKVAFRDGGLPWIEGDTAFAYHKRGDVVIGHHKVCIRDVTSIASNGEPVYTCISLASQDILMIEGGDLMTWNAMMFNKDGSLSVYHVWALDKMQQKQAQKERMISNPGPVRVRLKVPVATS